MMVPRMLFPLVPLRQKDTVEYQAIWGKIQGIIITRRSQRRRRPKLVKTHDSLPQAEGMIWSHHGISSVSDS